jgi:hypothetical protein
MVYEYLPEKAAKNQLGQVSCCAREDRTVGENLEFKITRLEEELARLKASRASLEPLLAMKVRDIRNAMDY